MASFFSALRLRVLSVISPAKRSNGGGRRSRQQSSLERTQGGRVTKTSTKKTETRNTEHLMSAAQQNDMADDQDGVSTNGSTYRTRSNRSSMTPARHRGRPYLVPKIIITPIKSETKPEVEGSEHGVLSPQVSKTEELEDTLDIEVEGMDPRQDATKLTHPDWSQCEIDLFNKLNNRGLEPVIPLAWEMDFKTVPPMIFTQNDKWAFINSLSGNDFRAARALSALFPLGSRARDRLSINLSPEPVLARAIAAYIKWSYEDAGLNQRDAIPALAICCGAKNEEITSVIARMETELHQLGMQYRDEFRVMPSLETEKFEKGKGKAVETEKDRGRINKTKTRRVAHTFPPSPSTSIISAPSTAKEFFDPPLPTLFGFVIVHTVVALVAYDSSVEDSELHVLSLLDFGKEDQDVWNSFSVAITAVWVRNYLVSLDWPLLELEESDPDA